MHKNKHIHFILMLVMLFIASCNPVTWEPAESVLEAPLLNTVTPDDVTPETPTFTASSNQHQEITRSPQATFPPQAENTERPAVPAMTVLETKNYFGKLLQTNGNCFFPCILGIKPAGGMNQEIIVIFDGVEEIDEENFYFNPDILQGQRSYQMILWEEDILTHANLNVIGKENQLYTISLQGQIIREITTEPWFQGEPANGEFSTNTFLQTYWLPNILRTYGRPSKVFLYTPGEDEMDIGNEPMSLMLLYKDQGFLVGYTFPRKIQDTEHFGCPSETEAYVISWVPDPDSNLFQMLRGTDWRAYAAGYRPIEEVSDFTVDEIYQVFQQPEAMDCITTPRDIWAH